MQNKSSVLWFVAGLILILILGSSTPKIAGGIVVALTIYLAAESFNPAKSHLS